MHYIQLSTGLIFGYNYQLTPTFNKYGKSDPIIGSLFNHELKVIKSDILFTYRNDKVIAEWC